MTVILRRLTAFDRFWYGFIVGDDWTVAATFATALFAAWLQRGSPGPAGRHGGYCLAGWRSVRQEVSGCDRRRRAAEAGRDEVLARSREGATGPIPSWPVERSDREWEALRFSSTRSAGSAGSCAG